MLLKITVHGTAYEVEVEVLDPGKGFPAPGLSTLPAGISPPDGQAPTDSVSHGAPPQAPAARPSSPPRDSAAAGGIASPIAGTILEIKCRNGEAVKQGQTLIVVEAMKMEASICAPEDATVAAVDVAVGDAIREGQVVIRLAT